MRIWDVPVKQLCRRHLLGEHHELHAVWAILTQGKKGYMNHPETRRWQGKLAALYRRHEEQVKEMSRRGYWHQSPLDSSQAKGNAFQQEFIDSSEKQCLLLKTRHCGCKV